MSAQSPLFVKTEAFIAWLLNHTSKFPNRERARLARQIENAIFGFHSHLIYAAKTDQTLVYLRFADAELDKLRAYLRLALEMGYTSPDQYEYIAGQIIEIGKLLGAWIKKSSS